jgi:CBS domain-containing protein
MTVGDICTRTVVTATPDDTIAEAARRMRDRHVGNLVVVDAAKRPIGILTDRDIVISAVAQSPDKLDALRVGDVMTGNVVTAHAHDTVEPALLKMRRLGIRRLPVVGHDGRLEGIVTLDDLLERIGNELDLLRSLVTAGQQRERVSRR